MHIICYIYLFHYYLIVIYFHSQPISLIVGPSRPGSLHIVLFLNTFWCISCLNKFLKKKLLNNDTQNIYNILSGLPTCHLSDHYVRIKICTNDCQRAITVERFSLFINSLCDYLKIFNESNSSKFLYK